MSASTAFSLFSRSLSVRFIQGYRYLDRCGECLIRLEGALDTDWILTETSPTSGSMKNQTLGMALSFNSEGFTVKQSDFLEFNIFLDQSCKIHDILWRTLDVNKINTPSVTSQYQLGFDEEKADAAEEYLLSMKLCQAEEGLVQAMGGKQHAIQFVVVTQVGSTAQDTSVERRRRFQAGVVRQERQPSFDARLLQRARTLSSKQRDALVALMRMKRQHPEIKPFAVQFDLEDSLDTELLTREFNALDFIKEARDWSDNLLNTIVKLRKG